MTIAARPTTYRGVPMRSRLEAKVAATFDRDEIEWTYEPRAYGNADGQYLPDFELDVNGHPVFFEAKPTMDAALRAMERMTIIWDSVPNAMLCVYADREGLVWHALGLSRLWRVDRWWVVI